MKHVDVNVELDFECSVNDLILVRSRALRIGELSFTSESYNTTYNYLAKEDVYSWSKVDNNDMSLCLVIGVERFPEDASNLDFLVLLHEGKICYAFDDFKSGFWIPFEEECETKDPKARSTRAWERHCEMTGLCCSLDGASGVATDRATPACHAHDNESVQACEQQCIFLTVVIL